MNDLSPIATDAATTRLLIDSGAIVGEQRTGTKRAWTTREIAVLRTHFPTGGINACLPLLPGRTAGAIYQRAAEQGLRKRNRRGGVTERQKYKTTPQIDAAIAQAYKGSTPRAEAIRRLCGALGRPRGWVNRRALVLGFAVPRFKDKPWSERELEILRQQGVKHPDIIRLKLKAEGFKRTSSAILLKQKHLRILRDVDENGKFTATALGEIFGVGRSTVAHWAEKGLLAGGRLRSFSAYEGKAPHDKAWWQFTRREVRDFVVQNVAIIDLARVDKFWLVDLLAGDPTIDRREGKGE